MNNRFILRAAALLTFVLPCLQACAAGQPERARTVASGDIGSAPVPVPCEFDFDCADRVYYCELAACIAGTCRFAERTCDDGDPATVDSCDDENAACVHDARK